MLFIHLVYTKKSQHGVKDSVNINVCAVYESGGSQFWAPGTNTLSVIQFIECA